MISLREDEDIGPMLNAHGWFGDEAGAADYPGQSGKRRSAGEDNGEHALDVVTERPTISGWVSDGWITRPVWVRVVTSQMAANIRAETSSMKPR
jgi:hypothetical protein